MKLPRIKRCIACRVFKPLTEFYKKDYRRINGDKGTSKCKPCQLAYLKEYNKRRGDRWRAEVSRKYQRKLKGLVVDAYGGKCECCGEARIEFLQIDHIHNDGASHRRELAGSHLYDELRKLGFPKDRFRLLCCNCNFARGKYGYCPHEKEREAYEISKNGKTLSVEAVLHEKQKTKS